VMVGLGISKGSLEIVPVVRELAERCSSSLKGSWTGLNTFPDVCSICTPDSANSTCLRFELLDDVEKAG
jgi:hypothetical protein